LLENKQDILMAMMGFGKTATSIGTAELLDRWPILIVAPGHTLHKWSLQLAQVPVW